MATSEDGIRDSERSGPYVAATRWMENLSDAQFAYLLLTPVLLLLGLIAFWPLLSTFWMSLHADNLVGSAALGEFIGLENYVALLTGERDALLVRPFLDLSTPFSSALTVTLIFTVFSVFFETLIGFAQALVLDQDFRGRRWVRVAIIIPWAVPIVIQGMIFFLLFQPNIGFLVDPLRNLGLFTATPLSNPVDSMIILIVADVWKTSAFMALIILAGLQSVDRSLYNVGRVAGASKFQQFWYITLPLVLPSVLVAMLFRTIGAMRIYGLIETVVGCNTVPSLSCLVVTTFRGSRMYGTSAAVAFITAGLIGIVVSVYIVKYADTETGA
ncbi:MULTISPECIES: carbohydrate ABC transporter permease [Halorussus]|uniref:carbohydrate ABC transporter permease n=1 Tax=Halorussus TaxID=1070314 RepID=UPI000E219466|nr:MULTISPECIES: sugar ABC transporter permease [Halorussus]NHN59095.1 sugar ABC transporter permease [Halorussus sp. JP-T4]